LEQGGPYKKVNDVAVGRADKLRINKDDYKNPEYGTKEHPVMCFTVKNIRLQMPNPDVYQFETLDEQFKYNIFMYLTYVMPHKEFKKRFGLPHTSD
jgi:hypothetical protein